MAHLNLADQPVGPTLYLHGIRKRFHVPEGLEPLMDEITRAVLRHQPENLHEFIADFLEKKVEDRKTAAREGRRHSWEWRRWSSDGSSLLDDEELKEFVAQFGIPVEAAAHLATIIQAVYRGFLARKKYQELIKSKQRRKESLWEEWLQEGQFFADGSDLQQILLHYGLTMIEANKFATKIQALFRGHLARKSLVDPILDEDPELEKQLTEWGITRNEAEKHAVTIQKFYRGHLQKKEMKEKASKFIDETNAATESILELEEKLKKEKEEREAKRRAQRKFSGESLMEQLIKRSRTPSPSTPEGGKSPEESEAEELYHDEEEEEYEGEDGPAIKTDLDYFTAKDLQKHHHHHHHQKPPPPPPTKSGEKGKTSTSDGTSMSRPKIAKEIYKSDTYEEDESEEEDTDE